MQTRLGEGREHLQKHTRAVEGDVWQNGGTRLQFSLLLERELLLRSSHLGPNQRIGSKDYEALVPFQKGRM